MEREQRELARYAESQGGRRSQRVQGTSGQIVYQRNNIKAVSRELGVSSSQLIKWRKDFADYGDNSFPGRGKERLTDEQREIKRLKSELKDKELDLAILKKAIALHKLCRKDGYTSGSQRELVL